MKRLIVTVVMLATLAVTTSPAMAATSWCGHTQRWGVTGLMTFEGAWTDRYGRHRHTVRVTRFITQETRYVWPVCPRHR